MDKLIEFRYGPACKSLEEQAKEQKISIKNISKFEELRRALNLLSFYILNDSEKDKLFNKLHKLIMKNINKNE